MFLHDIILEALNTAPVEDVKEKMTNLAKIEPETDKADIETKYEVAICINIITTKHSYGVIVVARTLSKFSLPEDSVECNVTQQPDSMHNNHYSSCK